MVRLDDEFCEKIQQQAEKINSLQEDLDHKDKALSQVHDIHQ